MIAEVIKFKQGDAGSYGRLVSYLVNDQGKQHRVGQIRLSNCHSLEHETAVLEVLDVQAANKRARNTTYHVVLSFSPGEEVSPQAMQLCEERVVQALGFAQHQRISVVHHDRDHLHVHLAINRVHPKTFLAHSPHHPYSALGRVCDELEQELGLRRAPHRNRAARQREAAVQLTDWVQRRCAAELSQARSWTELQEMAHGHGLQLRQRGNGLVLIDDEGASVRASSVARELSKASLEKRLGPIELEEDARPEGRPSVPKMQYVSGEQSLVQWVRENCGRQLQAVSSWQELHELAAAHGLHVRLRGNGLIVQSAEGTAVKGSSISRTLSKAALQKRLGPFVAAQGAGVAVDKRYERRPLPAAGREVLYQRYLAERAASAQAKEHALARAKAVRDRELKEARWRAERRWAVAKFVSKGAIAWKIWSADARRGSDRDFKAVRRRYQEARRNAFAVHRNQGFRQWLQARAAEGDLAAIAALRAGRARAAEPARGITGAGRERPTPLLQRPDSVTPAGSAIYSLFGVRVRDDGAALHADELKDDQAAEQLLRLARARFGAQLDVAGGEAFRQQLVRAAAGGALGVQFVDARMQEQLLALQGRNHGRTRREGDVAASFGKGSIDKIARVDARAAELDAVALARPRPSLAQDRLHRVPFVDLATGERGAPLLLPLDAPRHVPQPERHGRADHPLRRRAPSPGRVTDLDSGRAVSQVIGRQADERRAGRLPAREASRSDEQSSKARSPGRDRDSGRGRS